MAASIRLVSGTGMTSEGCRPTVSPAGLPWIFSRTGLTSM